MSIPPDRSRGKKSRTYTSTPPDWLVSGKPGPETPPAAMPDWFKFQPSAGTTASSEPPDWLAKVIASTEATRPAPSGPPPSSPFQADDSQAALRPAPFDEEPDEKPSKPGDSLAALRPAPFTGDDDLFAALRADTAKPPVAEPLDWMTPKAAEDKPAEEPAALPDWMSEFETPAAPPATSEPAALPDWMASPADEAKPAEEPPAVPDWMAAADAAKPGEEPTTLPDWLSASGIASTESAPPSAKVPGMSGLLGRLSTGALPPPPEPGGTVEATPSEATGTGGLGETPDWLDELSQKDAGLTPEAPPPDWLGETSSTSPEASSLTLPPAAPTKTPDWLEELAKEESAALPPAPESVTASDAPDWLDQVMKDDTTPAAPAESLDLLGEMPSAMSGPEAPAPAAVPTETPDWLDQLAKTEPEPTETTPAVAPEALAAPPASIETPDWLDQLAKTGPEPIETTPAAAPEAPAAPPASIETPDWLDQLAKAGLETSAASPEAPAPAAAPTETPDWLDQLAKAGPEPIESTPAAAPEAPPAPPADLESGETPGEPLPVAPPAPAPSSDDLADLLSGMDLGMPTEGASTGEDLLGMSGDLAPTPETRVESGEAEANLPDDLPDWLRTMQAAPDQPGRLAAKETSLPAESLSGLDDLRFNKLVGETEAPQPASAEKVGALKDVVGAIRPELIFDAQTLKGGHLAAEQTLTKEQSQRIELLEDLLAHKTEEVVISGPRRSTLPIMRWLVAALLIAAVVATIVMKFSLLTEPSPASSGPADAGDMLSSLSGESKIVVAFDYEPDTSAEMDPLALAILGKIASQTGASVYAVSTRATGPALAQRAIEKTLVNADKAQRDRWLNLGYIPGGPNGITTLVIGSPAGLPSALSVNALGQSSGVAELSLAELKPTLIIVLTASAEDLRAWVEQAGRPTSIPMIAATSVGNMPMAAPYRQSRQVSALLSGVNDAVALRSITGQDPDPATTSIWNTQATGALVATLLIIVGGAIYGLTALRNHQEQGQ